jgi:integrase
MVSAAAPPQRVQVFALGKPRATGPRRYYVKWRVDGRDRTRAFKTRAEGDRFRSRLLAAVEDGVFFDLIEGLPETWLAKADGPTWWSWAREWLGLKWPQWSGHSRRSAVETLASFTPHLLRPGAPPPPAELRAWLRADGLHPDRTPSGEQAAWLGAWSVPLLEIDPPLLETALRTVLVRQDGVAMAATVVRRYRNQLATVLRSAVRRGVLPTSPMDRVEWRNPSHSFELDVSTVPSPADVDAAVEWAWDLPTAGARFAALFAAVGMAGLRPSEAAGLTLQSLELPKSGWGLARVRGAITSPGPRFTLDGEPLESKGLKHRARNAVREVPLPPALVDRLHAHAERFDTPNGRLFTNARGEPIASSNYGPVWVRVRTHLWPKPHPLSGTTVYDLRHSAATMMLRAGVPPAEVARRLGHSVDVLLRVYAGVYDDERERSNALIEAALAGDA